MRNASIEQGSNVCGRELGLGADSDSSASLEVGRMLLRNILIGLGRSAVRSGRAVAHCGGCGNIDP